MDFNVPDRVHIMPVGYEKPRVTKSAIGYKADKVVLIGHEEDGEEDEVRLDEIESILEEQAIEVERTECDIFDLYDSLGLIAEIINRFKSEEVYVNVSTGSKVTAIAGMIACMAIDATAYYAKAKDYSGEYPDDIEFVQELPNYPIDAPERQQIVTLYVIEKMQARGLNPTKGKLIYMGQQLSLPFVTENDVKDKGKYRVLDKEIIEPMQEREYITITQEGRSKVVELTEEGENALRAFRYLVRPDQEEVVEFELDSERMT